MTSSYSTFFRRLSHLYERPAFLFLLLVVSIFVAEAAVMLVLGLLPPLPVWTEALLDALFLSLIAVPILHCLFLRPMRFNIHTRETAEAERRKAEEFHRLKSEFISTAAHELNTPLAAIRGYVELMQSEGDSFDSGARREFLTIIHDKSVVLERIVDDLLELGHLERGGAIDLQLEQVDILAALQEALDARRLLSPSHRIETELPPDLPLLNIDRIRLQQVVGNLLDNAAKYSPPGSVIRLIGRCTEGAVQIGVRDEGIGMSSEQAARAFEKFYRADSSNTARGGLGLGLSIARAIVEGHGGRTWLESAPGRGTTVWATLPIPGNGDDSGGSAAGDCP